MSVDITDKILQQNDAKCYWTFLECADTEKRKGIAYAWNLESDCGHEIYMTRENKWYQLYKKTLAPHPVGTKLGIKCPYCGGELSFYNPYED